VLFYGRKHFSKHTTTTTTASAATKCSSPSDVGCLTETFSSHLYSFSGVIWLLLLKLLLLQDEHLFFGIFQARACRMLLVRWRLLSLLLILLLLLGIG
jgi:hypothetical protein